MTERTHVGGADSEYEVPKPEPKIFDLHIKQLDRLNRNDASLQTTVLLEPISSDRHRIPRRHKLKGPTYTPQARAETEKVSVSTNISKDEIKDIGSRD